MMPWLNRLPIGLPGAQDHNLNRDRLFLDDVFPKGHDFPLGYFSGSKSFGLNRF